jgi:hypothetical protein
MKYGCSRKLGEPPNSLSVFSYRGAATAAGDLVEARSSIIFNSSLSPCFISKVIDNIRATHGQVLEGRKKDALKIFIR